VIVGHSERRARFGETDAIVRDKARAVIEAGMTPIVCVGERLDERESGRTDDVVRAQIEGSLRNLPLEQDSLVVAYEPVWAIGTGRTATAEQAQQVHAMIRNTLGGSVRILYGGSLKPDNAAAIFGQPDVDGGLVGGASLDAKAFAAIVRAALPGP
jgi:triosephosphate isomerase